MSTSEDQASAAVAIGASDIDRDRLIYSLKQGAEPSKGTVSFSGDKFTYTPADNANGADAFTIVVSDGHGGSVEQRVSVSIAPINDPPSAPATNSVATSEDQASAAVAIGASDIDGAQLSYSLKSGAGPSKGTVLFSGDKFTYTPADNANGGDTFTILITDGNGPPVEQAVSVSIAPVDDAPSAPATNSVATSEDRPSAAVAIGASDVDGDQLFYSLKPGAEPSKGTVLFSGGKFTYTPADNANGADAFTILITDGNGPPVEQAVSVSIAADDDAPTSVSLSPHVQRIVESRPAQRIKVADISIADIDGGAHALALAGPDAANFEIVGSAVFLKARTALDFETKTSYAFAVAVDDGSAPGSDATSQLLTIHIANASGRYVGTAAANRLTGSAEEDVILGLGGNDVLAGGTGNDAIAGGAGRDVMAGGAGADTFLFKSVRDSTGPTGVLVNNWAFLGNNGPDHRDLITDFAHGADRINLSAIDANSKLAGNQAFTFAGGEALAKRIGPDGPDFSGRAGELHVVRLGAVSDMTLVEGDTNGDGIADLQILLRGHTTLTKADFVL